MIVFNGSIHSINLGITGRLPNGLRYWRLVENQVHRREPLKAQAKAKKRGAYQPSSARYVRCTHGTPTSLTGAVTKLLQMTQTFATDKKYDLPKR